MLSARQTNGSTQAHVVDALAQWKLLEWRRICMVIEAQMARSRIYIAHRQAGFSA